MLWFPCRYQDGSPVMVLGGISVYSNINDSMILSPLCLTQGSWEWLAGGFPRQWPKSSWDVCVCACRYKVRELFLLKWKKKLSLELVDHQCILHYGSVVRNMGKFIIWKVVEDRCCTSLTVCTTCPCVHLTPLSDQLYTRSRFHPCLSCFCQTLLGSRSIDHFPSCFPAPVHLLNCSRWVAQPSPARLVSGREVADFHSVSQASCSHCLLTPWLIQEEGKKWWEKAAYMVNSISGRMRNI